MRIFKPVVDIPTWTTCGAGTGLLSDESNLSTSTRSRSNNTNRDMSTLNVEEDDDVMGMVEQRGNGNGTSRCVTPSPDRESVGSSSSSSRSSKQGRSNRRLEIVTGRRLFGGSKKQNVKNSQPGQQQEQQKQVSHQEQEEQPQEHPQHNNRQRRRHQVVIEEQVIGPRASSSITTTTSTTVEEQEGEPATTTVEVTLSSSRVSDDEDLFVFDDDDDDERDDHLSPPSPVCVSVTPPRSRSQTQAQLIPQPQAPPSPPLWKRPLVDWCGQTSAYMPVSPAYTGGVNVNVNVNVKAEALTVNSVHAQTTPSPRSASTTTVTTGSAGDGCTRCCVADVERTIHDLLGRVGCHGWHAVLGLGGDDDDVTVTATGHGHRENDRRGGRKEFNQVYTRRVRNRAGDLLDRSRRILALRRNLYPFDHGQGYTGPEPRKTDPEALRTTATFAEEDYRTTSTRAGHRAHRRRCRTKPDTHDHTDRYACDYRNGYRPNDCYCCDDDSSFDDGYDNDDFDDNPCNTSSLSMDRFPLVVMGACMDGATRFVQDSPPPLPALPVHPMVGLLRRDSSWDDLCYDSDPGSLLMPRKLHHRNRGFVSPRERPIGAGLSHPAPRTILNFDVRNDVARVSAIVQDTINRSMTLVWHPCQTTDTSNIKAAQPVSVHAWIERGQQIKNTLLQPKLVWREHHPRSSRRTVSKDKHKSQQSQKLQSQAQGGVAYTQVPKKQDQDSLASWKAERSVDLLDISHILSVEPGRIDRRKYPLAPAGRSFLVEHFDHKVVFEAESTAERDRIVLCLKLTVARLGSKIILNDTSFFDEFFLMHPSSAGDIQVGPPES